MNLFATPYRIWAMLIPTALPLSALTEWPVGRGAVTLGVTGSAAYDSNISGNANSEDDVYFSFSPTARYRRIDSLISTDASLGFVSDRYVDNKNFDSDSIRANYALTLPRTGEQSYGMGFQAGYNESFDVDPDLNERVSSKTFRIGVNGELILNRVHAVRANAGYSNSTRDLGSDQEAYNVGTSYAYSFNDGTSLGASYTGQATQTESRTTGQPSLDQISHAVAANVSRPLYGDVTGTASIGYRWLDRGDEENAEGLEDTDRYTLSLGLQGQFLPRRYFPKTTGTFRIAYEDSVSPGVNDNSSRRVVGSVDVNWQARETTDVSFGVSRSQSLSAADATVVNNTINARVNQRLGHFMTASANVGFTKAVYAGSERTDDRYSFGAALSYQINAAWSSGLNYSYTVSQSSSARADFDRHVVTLSASYVF